MPPKTTRHAGPPAFVLAAALLASTAVVTACTAAGAGSGPAASVTASGGGSPSGSATTSTRATATASTSATAAPTPTVDPNIPPAAKANTKEGAEAFSHYFFTQWNRSFKEADPALLSPLSLSSCKSCTYWMQRAADLRSKGHRLEGELFTMSGVFTTKLTGAEAEVVVKGEQKGTRVLDPSGNKVDDVPVVQGSFFLTLAYDQLAGWRVRTWQVQA